MSNTVPEGWVVSKVGELSQVKRGASPRPIQDPKWWGGNVGWVRISDVTSSFKYLNTTTQYLSKEGVSKSVQIPVGEVILSICATIGRPIIVGVNACIHDGFVWFDKLKASIDREYWYYFLLSKEEFLSGQRQSGTQGNLNTSIVAELECPLPPLPEQTKIAAILSSVDDVIEKTRAQIDKLKYLKTGMMQELLTKGIGHTEFKDSPVGRIPASWKVLPLEELCTKVSVGIASSTTHAYASSGVPLLRNQNILPNAIRRTDVLYISREFSDENASKKIKEGDVLTVRTGYPGISAVVPKEFDGCHSFTTLISRPRKSLLNCHYLSLLINSDYGKHFVVGGQAGGAQQNLNATTLKTFPVPLPPLAEQVAIYDAANSISAKVALAEKKYRSLVHTKKALMQDLLTGKVRVNVDQKESAVV